MHVFRPATLLKRNSNIGVFLWTLQKTSANDTHIIYIYIYIYIYYIYILYYIRYIIYIYYIYIYIILYYIYIIYIYIYYIYMRSLWCKQGMDCYELTWTSKTLRILFFPQKLSKTDNIPIFPFLFWSSYRGQSRKIIWRLNWAGGSGGALWAPQRGC